MGWQFNWVSSLQGDFNFASTSRSLTSNGRRARYNFQSIGDPGIDELPGMSAFAFEDRIVYHTYSCFARGGDVLMGIYQLLDRAPRGRNEEGMSFPMEWVRRKDEYEDAGAPAAR